MLYEVCIGYISYIYKYTYYLYTSQVLHHRSRHCVAVVTTRCGVPTRTGVGSHLDEKVLEWAKTYSAVYVVSGVVLDANNDGQRDPDDAYSRYCTTFVCAWMCATV